MSDIKRFDEWNSVKKVLDNKEIQPKVEIRRIYWFSIGQNVGSEVFGKNKFFTRPVLVVNVFPNDTFLGIPLSSKTKNKRGKFYHIFKDSKGKLQVALLGQIRVFDTKRKSSYISKIDDENFAKIKEKIKSEIIK